MTSEGESTRCSKNTLVKIFMWTTKFVMLFHHSETGAILHNGTTLYTYTHIYINSITFSHMKTQSFSRA